MLVLEKELFMVKIVEKEEYRGMLQSWMGLTVQRQRQGDGKSIA